MEKFQKKKKQVFKQYQRIYASTDYIKSENNNNNNNNNSEIKITGKKLFLFNIYYKEDEVGWGQMRWGEVKDKVLKI